ncbi:DCR2 Dosage-dependent positive regulator [Fusarium subglutinans]|uniref:DCR2 Dosage-dependent positive regulator n=1 Tax=Gibberella subglutinans TaxID=42677 RepID=A0A8H5P9H2_GIBSU|nr:DCR2 Dosage-dependent positive regulator [Fusarium subglutinans]KAF5592432.1 DCR2 Dosage-dependent positive regulator [Fusarium subglutinans]
MTRRIVRTAAQLAGAAIFTFLVIAFLDRNYRVLPNSIHSYMPSHHPGLVVTDVTIVTCSSVNPFSSCDLGKEWHRIDKELYLGKTWTTSAYMYIMRKHEGDLTADDRVVVDIAVGRLQPQPKGETDDPWESRPSGIWIKRSAKKKASDSKQAVTDLDVLFGDDAVEARDGYAVTGTPLLLNTGGSLLSVQLSVRRGPPREVKKPTPRINSDGRYKIMQIGDLHLSTGVGVCREAVPDSYNGGKCEADPRTLEFISRVLDDEKPDLVVLSGDQVNGDTAPDAPTAMFKIISLLIERRIPYAAIFGNHDDEQTMSREAQMAIMETLPYSLSIAGPADIEGVGNYYIEVLARGKTDHSALTIYLLDTHAYSPDERNFPGYDWVKPNQIEWFKKTAAGLKKNHNEFTGRHMDIAFIHIPLTEYANPELPRVGDWKEGVTAPIYNSGFRDALVEQGVLMVSAGHDHCNDYCSLSLMGEGEAKVPAMWMCYAGGSGFGGYAGYGGYHRRVRLFEVDINEARIKTWKRLEYGDIAGRIHQQIIVDGGKPQPITPIS